MKVRPNLLDKNSPKGLEGIQLTTESEVPNSPIWSHRSSLRIQSDCSCIGQPVRRIEPN